jgi:peptide/nickel transport system permease protein
LTLLVLSLVVFASVHLTGDPALVLIPESPDVSAELFLKLKQEWGLDDPFFVQYLRFLRKVVTGLDFGDSLVHQRPVRDMLLERLPYTLQLTAAGMFLSIAIGLPLGILSAVKRDSIIDQACKLFAVFGMAAPQFWIAIMLIILFAAKLGWLPAYGAGSFKHLILPAVVVSFFIMAGIIRLGRSSMLEVMDSEYIKFARVKGLRERFVVWKHALRNASFSLLTFGGLELAGLLNGAIVVEVVFAWPGLGKLMVDGVVQRNFPLVEGAALASAFFFISTALLVDILYAFMDPRIRRG